MELSLPVRGPAFWLQNLNEPGPLEVGPKHLLSGHLASRAGPDTTAQQHSPSHPFLLQTRELQPRDRSLPGHTAARARRELEPGSLLAAWQLLREETRN